MREHDDGNAVDGEARPIMLQENGSPLLQENGAHVYLEQGADDSPAPDAAPILLHLNGGPLLQLDGSPLLKLDRGSGTDG